MEDQDGSEFGVNVGVGVNVDAQGRVAKPSKRRKKGDISFRKIKKFVFLKERKMNVPPMQHFDWDGGWDCTAQYIFVEGLDDGEKYQVDRDDFCTMIEVMNAWPRLFCLPKRTPRLFCLPKRIGELEKNPLFPRINSAFDVLKEFLRVDEENGSYKVIKADLSQLVVENMERNPTSVFRHLSIPFLPVAFGKLAHLQELNLGGTHISELPIEILLGCKRLKVLNLTNTRYLERLPDEIGNLLELRELCLHNSLIRSLPRHSILGKLQKLQILDLSETQVLEQIENNDCSDIDGDGFTPIHHWDVVDGREEGFGRQMHAVVESEGEKLTNLRKLDLRHSAIIKGSLSSPPLWKNDIFRRLFMSSNRLCELDLRGAKGLTRLEDVIRNTSRLKRLNISFTDIATLPPSTSKFYDKLVHLKVLSLTSTPVLRKYPEQMKKMMEYNKNNYYDDTNAAEGPPTLRNLALGRHSVLGCVGLRRYQTDCFLHHRKLSLGLALNRAKFRITSSWKAQVHHDKEGGCHDHIAMFHKALWPILLAERAVDLHKPYEECNDKNCDCQTLPEEPDALFGLIMTFSNEIFGDNRKLSVNNEDENSYVVVGEADGEDDWTLLQ